MLSSVCQCEKCFRVIRVSEAWTHGEGAKARKLCLDCARVVVAEATAPTTGGQKDNFRNGAPDAGGQES